MSILFLGDYVYELVVAICEIDELYNDFGEGVDMLWRVVCWGRG